MNSADCQSIRTNTPSRNRGIPGSAGSPDRSERGCCADCCSLPKTSQERRTRCDECSAPLIKLAGQAQEGNEGDARETLAEIAVRIDLRFYADRHDSHLPAGQRMDRAAFLAAYLWVMATLYDAHLGFLTFFCRQAWRERSFGTKVVWFVLIMSGGNMAISLYVLLQLFGLRPDEPASALFRQKAA